ncbi:MAG: hypothetical protein WCT29_02845 [Candidatus Paceibacterota bacterium]|jgi:hypothetical protein
MTAGAISPSSILVNVSPENPAPDESVYISLNSYAANLDSVAISWLVNGKTVSSGIGKKSLTVTAPGAGQEMRISTSIAFADGKVDKNIVLRPAVMALIWQANDAYVPPFYKGKALPTTGSDIKIVAMPELKSGSQPVNIKNMVYAWKKDYNNDQGASGYGKNFYIFTNDYLEDSNVVSVVASTTDQKYSSAGEITVGIFEPKILFYKNDASLGTLWEHALADGHRINGEEILEAAPYYISPEDIRLPSLTWDWSINGTYVGVSSLKKNALPVKANPGASGTSRIKVEINNKYKLFTSAEKELDVQF